MMKTLSKSNIRNMLQNVQISLSHQRSQSIEDLHKPTVHFQQANSSLDRQVLSVQIQNDQKIVHPIGSPVVNMLDLSSIV